MEANPMGEFIRIIINQDKCEDIVQTRKWVTVCPVNIFEVRKDKPVVIAENEDECTLCELCLQSCPEGAITIEKLYE
jgi:NAD-dependent dihydropyrimidine dehydrogenase PreA subunit